MTSETHGPHRRNDKSEYQECTCKMDKSLNRGMFNKFESRQICVAGYQFSGVTVNVLVFVLRVVFFSGAFHSTQNSGNFGWFIKWNGPFRFGPTGTFGTSFEGGPQ